MHAPTLTNQLLDHARRGHVHHRSFVRNLQAHLRGWSRNENIVATFSLTVIVTTVFILLSKAM
jgi:hypothetical protein